MPKDKAYSLAEKRIDEAIKENRTEFSLRHQNLTKIPESIGFISNLKKLDLSNNKLTELPESIGQLTQLQELNLRLNKLTEMPQSMSKLIRLQSLNLSHNHFTEIPESIVNLTDLETLYIYNNYLFKLSEDISKLTSLTRLYLANNELANIPPSLGKLEHLKVIELKGNPLNPALQSAYEAGLDELKAYLRSLVKAKPLYEAKLVLVGEGGVGKTTLLNALIKKEDRAPKEDETTTHGVKIDVDALQLPHPDKEGVQIQLNAWDFGGQEVYRVTHQFFFSKRSLYILVWEPRRGVQQCQVEDWLNMIRLRVGDDARVIIVSTYSKSGEHIARIDKPVFQGQYGEMIVGFHEVDSLVPDEKSGEMVGIAELKEMIAKESAKLEQMGMGFNINWKAARDELIQHPEPRISYEIFAEICGNHGLSEIDTETLAHLMHDLGYIVHYSDDEKLRDDVVLKPEWLTKAIGFVLEDRATQELDGILNDSRLFEVWHDHQFKNEPKYQPELYPFFLRLMEKYDVSYRLPDGKASLVAQHVPQVRPELPWLPEQEKPENLRRIAMICAMDGDPPGLVPWMIVRTHDYATEQSNEDGETHRLHWQKGMFLSYPPHGEAMLEKRGREFHVYTQADWPEYFTNVIQHTLQKLITDNWPGLEGRYRFAVPCPEQIDGKPCKGRFNIHALRQFLAEGDRTTRCQECHSRQSISELLFGFEERSVDAQLREIQEQLAGMNSRIASYFMATMRAIADEAKHGPRLFTLRAADVGLSPTQLFSQSLELQLWCEAEGCQHPVIERGKGIYKIEKPHEWVTKIAPYASFALKVLSTVAPMAAPAINTFFGTDTTKTWGIDDQLKLANAIIGKLPNDMKVSEHSSFEGGMLSEPERSGILALHQLIKEQDSTQANLGLHRITTYTGDYRWLCRHHYDAWQPNIPDVIE